ncbi:hypothetical protein Tco_1399387 [Tanacetum coccineum]
MANGEDYLDGCDGASGGEVKGGRVDFGVLKSSPGEIPSETMGERGGDMMGLGKGPVWFKLQYCVDGSAGSMCSMEPSFSNEGNRLLQNCRKLFVLVCAYMKTMWRCGHLDSKEGKYNYKITQSLLGLMLLRLNVLGNTY